ncbi:hypothetical protein D3Z48_08265 [Clostridiaceae bacterium]|nr:hypothetical protein [Clostridiaceae bacterium]
MTVFVGFIHPIRACKPLIIGDKFAACGRDFELNTLQWLSRNTVLFDNNQAPFRLVPKFECHCLVSLDFDRLRNVVQHIPRPRAGFLCNHGHAGFEAVNADCAGAVHHIFTVRISDHIAVAACQLEFDIRKWFAGRSILFDDEQAALFVVSECYRYDILFLAGKVDRLRGIADDIPF